jgi:hypothetical protein
MNLHAIAAELTRRRHDLAKETNENAEQFILGLLMAQFEITCKQLKADRDCWLFNAQQLQKQVNEYELEIKKLKQAASTENIERLAKPANEFTNRADMPRVATHTFIPKNATGSGYFCECGLPQAHPIHYTGFNP